MSAILLRSPSMSSSAEAIRSAEDSSSGIFAILRCGAEIRASGGKPTHPAGLCGNLKPHRMDAILMSRQRLRIENQPAGRPLERTQTRAMVAAVVDHDHARANPHAGIVL